MGAIYVMWFRQIKKYWRSKPRMIASLGQPMLFLVALGFGFGAIYSQAGQGNFIDFLVPGIIAMSILFTAMFTGIEVIWDRQFGFLKETLVAPVSRMRIFLGRVLGGATVSTAQGLIVLIITFFIGYRPFNLLYLPVALVFMFSIAILFTAFGTAIASRMEDMQAFPLVMNFIVMPIFFLSGALFPLNDVPSVINTVARFNPLSYGVDGLRASLSGVSHLGIFTDFIILAILFVLMLLLGAYLFEKIEV
jgi:ABC-2 type transport system permease protein